MESDDRLRFLRGPLPPMFQRRVIVVAPGRLRAFDEADWSDALVVVESGAIELECRDGGRRRFGSGDILWLTGLPLRALHNRTAEPAVLVAVSRSKMVPSGSESDPG